MPNINYLVKRLSAEPANMWACEIVEKKNAILWYNVLDFPSDDRFISRWNLRLDNLISLDRRWASSRLFVHVYRTWSSNVCVSLRLRLTIIVVYVLASRSDISARADFDHVLSSRFFTERKKNSYLFSVICTLEICRLNHPPTAIHYRPYQVMRESCELTTVER